ncbi:MAG: VOC family protein [Ilumatobacteraceae bacterium]
MTEPTPANAGEPCWIDLLSSDTDAATTFYGDVFGWTAESAGPEYGGYINFSSKDGTRIAGCMKKDPETMVGMPDAWSVYLASDDAQATCDAAVAAGGGVMLPPMEVPEIGNMAYVTDPSGAAVGLFQTTGQVSFGYDGVGEGTPAWFELFTKDFAPTIAFYEQVFGWKTSSMGDTDEFRYSTLGDGDDAKAGVMDASAFLPEGVPAHWSVYLRVADTDATIASITEHGGSVVMPAEDTPYGRLATVADPTGAVFKVMGPSAG